MATIVPAPSGTHKALVRMKGWRAVSKTFRLKRDAIDWARRIEDEMVSWRIYLAQRLRAHDRAAGAAALPAGNHADKEGNHSAQRSYHSPAPHRLLRKLFDGRPCSELVASYRDHRLASGKSNNTVRIELAMLSNLFAIAIQEWGLGLAHNPVATIPKPSPGKGRDRRLTR
jgi:hypothetical protein